MIIPEEFKRLAEGFYQGSADEYSTPDEWIPATVHRLDAK
jgi:hypothetical protein